MSFLPPNAQAQEDANYDEDQVPDYTLPDPLVLEDGTPVESADVWQNQRRPELVGLFEENVYGKAPEPPEGMRFEVTSEDTAALGGLATRRQVTIIFLTKPTRRSWTSCSTSPTARRIRHPRLSG